MMNKKSIAVVFCVLFSVIVISFSSASPQDVEGSSSIQNLAVKVFLEGFNRYEEFIKTEIRIVNYVRDPKQAQVFIMLTKQQTGSGGTEFTLTFEGQENFGGLNDTLKYVSKEDDTDDTIRKGLVKKLKIGLVRYISETPFADRINVSILQPKKEEEVEDKWKYWVFRINMHSFLHGEEQMNSTFIRGGISASKVNNDWKIRLNFSSHYDEDNFTIEDETISSYSRGYNLFGLVVRSINDHWSFGGSFGVNSSTYNNIKISYNIAPAVEFNVFPYSKSTWRQLRILYKIGVQHRKYNEETIYFKTSEKLIGEKLEIILEIKEKWGTVSSSVELFHYLHDFGKNRIEWDNELDIRIFQGFSFNIRGSVSRIRNQLSLPKEDATREEVLLRRSQLKTGYIYFSSVGFQYTFGSIYNNIVNPRFGH